MYPCNNQRRKEENGIFVIRCRRRGSGGLGLAEVVVVATECSRGRRDIGGKRVCNTRTGILGTVIILRRPDLARNNSIG